MDRVSFIQHRGQKVLLLDYSNLSDEREMLAGRIKPTHMLAVLTREENGRLICLDGKTPESSVRRPT